MLACTVLAEQLNAAGLAIDREAVIADYIGKRWPDILAQAETALGRTLAPDFSDRTRAEMLLRFQAELREVEGASTFLQHFPALPRCIASSSSVERLALCVRLLELESAFAGRVFSADLVTRGKPHPDIFLYAATKIGVPPEACLVIEDSPSGVLAGKAAGMMVVGLCAGAHIRDGHAQRLHEAGADHIAYSWAEVAVLMGAA